MSSRVARVEIKVAEKLYRRTQRAFLLNLLVFFMNIVSCYHVKGVHCSFSKNIHLYERYYISGRWRREEETAARMIKKLLFEERSNLQ